MKSERLLPAMMAMAIAWFTPASAPAQQVLSGVMPEAVARLHLQPVGRPPATNHLKLAIGLPLRNREALAKLLHQLYDPASPHYHKFLSPEQFAEKFGPTEQDYQAVVAFAKAGGLTVTRTHRNRTLLDVSGAVADIEKTFHVTLRLYHHPREPRMFYAPDAEPSVAREVPILSVGGLNNYLLPRPMNLKAAAGSRPAGARPQAGSGPGGNYIGNDFRAAYVPGVALNGSGQTVGLLEFDGYASNDIASYESLASLPAVSLTNVLLDGSNGSAGGNSDEVSLDIEMAISMAPGLAGVVVYEGGFGDDILNEMATPSQGEPLSLQLSASWTFYTDANTEQIFQQFAAQGQSYFNASGDSDAYVSGADVPTPAGDTNITSVGGTTLTTSGPGGSWQSETAWNWGFNSNAGYDVGTSGGVTSFDIPVWQQGVDMSTNQGSTTQRNIPDVALTADNVWVIYGNGQAGEFGGTSCAAPLWAAYTALVNQQAAAYGRPPAGFINPDIYALAEGPQYEACFHDITTGNNFNSGSPNLYHAVPGYDLCTGWGTPNGAGLINALAPPDGLVIAPFNGFSSSGSPGGPFTVTAQSLTLTNLGTNSLDWSINNSSPWLDLSTNGGTLAPNEASTTVTVSLDPVAGSFVPGTYTATLWFTNLDDSVGQGRTFTLQVLGAPVISTQPQNQLVVAGDTAVFAVNVSGATPLTYCWQLNGSGILGATNATYSMNSVQLPDSGSQFRCVATNAYGAVTSSVAALTVVPPPLYSFGGPDGSNPYGGLVQGIDGCLYGTTQNGMSQNGGYAPGTVFQISTNGALTTLALFNYANGSIPVASLVQGDDGNFYGTTTEGGYYNYSNPYGYGTVFRISTAGILTSLASFNVTNGANPFCSLVQGSDGNLYGTTAYGGDYTYGTVFMITTNGVLTTLVSFNNTNGANPIGGLVQATDGNFYGTTYGGGANGDGTVFKMASDGTLTTLVSFNNADGANPYGGLVQATDGSFYGTTELGGTAGNGTVFKMASDGTLTTLVSFNYNSNGAYPQAALVQGSDGSFYGTTDEGGDYGYGTVFKVARDGTLTILLSFAGINGAYPAAAGVVQGADGNLYGTTDNGGDNDDGTVYRVVPPPSPPAIVGQPLDQIILAGGTAVFSVSATGSTPLSYQWQFLGTNISGATNGSYSVADVVTGDEGGYNVIVNNNYGSVTSRVAVLTVALPPGVINYGGQPVVFFPNIATTNYVLQMTTNPASGDWVTVTGGVPFSGLQITDAPDAAFFRLNLAAQTVTQVGAGGYYSLFLKSDGSLWAMGSDIYGQLGDGKYTFYPDLGTNLPEQIVAGNVTTIAAGQFHALFLKSDGSLWAMGNNYYGQLGDGTINNTNLPEQIMASNVVAIAAGSGHSLFLKNDGSLWAMGGNYSGQLGDGTYNNTNRPELIVTNGVTAIAAGGDHSMFLKSDGSLWTMGDNYSGESGDGTYSTNSPYDGINLPEQVVASNVTAIAAGAAHNLFLKSDGSLWAMGYDNYGQLGDGVYSIFPNMGTSRPEQIVAGDVTAVAAGLYHSLFLKNDGSLWGMGYDTDGELGDGKSYWQTNLPEQIVAGNVALIAAGSMHSLFVKNDGSLWAMGDDYYGQLGDGIIDPNPYPPLNFGSNLPEQIQAVATVAMLELGISTYGGQPVVMFPTVSNVDYWLMMTTNLASGDWTTVTNGVPFSGLQITNASSPVYFRLY